MRPFRRCFLTLATIAAPALLLAGCGGSQLASFDLAAAPMGKMRAGAIRGVLAVAEPVAEQASETQPKAASEEGNDVDGTASASGETKRADVKAVGSAPLKIKHGTGSPLRVLALVSK